jgi:predicted DNA-binding transcriptional regulator YafY
LSPEKVKDLRLLLDCLHVGRLSNAQDLSDLSDMDADLLPAFETAFLQKRMLQFCYRDAQGTHTDRMVEPQAMLILPPLWYLVAWDPLRSDFRHFRMDRIASPKVSNDAFPRRRRAPFDDDVCPFSELADRTRSKVQRQREHQ